MDMEKNIYFADSDNDAIRHIHGFVLVSTFAGAPPTIATSVKVAEAAADNNNNKNGQLGEIVTNNRATRRATIVPFIRHPFTDGSTELARFIRPSGIARDFKSGRVYVAEPGSHRVRVIDLATPDEDSIKNQVTRGAHSASKVGLPNNSSWEYEQAAAV
eukprot:jgi/Bigna1/88074/estExt_fgenesh1_pg.C_270199